MFFLFVAKDAFWLGEKSFLIIYLQELKQSKK